MDDEEPFNLDVPVKFELLLPAILVALVVVVASAIYLVRQISDDHDDGPQDAGRPRRPAPIGIRDDEGPVLARAPARRARGARNRMVQQAARQEESEEEVEQIQEEFEDDAGKTKKVGAKKARKLEMKAEKQARREQELAEREDRRERQEVQDERRRQEAEKEEQEEKQKEEEEEKQKAELERQEEEAYQLLKGCFEVQEEGFEEVLTETESQNLLQEFISYIKNEKVVLLEDLGAHFNIKTQDAIQRVQDLQEQGLLTGVIDDRGKFIFISQDELEGVAKFMQQRGRVSISDLAEASNTLVFLNTKTESPVQESVTA